MQDAQARTRRDNAAKASRALDETQRAGATKRAAAELDGRAIMRAVELCRAVGDYDGHRHAAAVEHNRTVAVFNQGLRCSERVQLRIHNEIVTSQEIGDVQRTR